MSGKRNKFGIETVYRASHDVGTAKQGQLLRSLRNRERRPTGKATLLNHRKRQPKTQQGYPAKGL